MRKALAGLLFSLGLASPALAQQVSQPIPNAGIYGAYNSGAQTCVSGTGCWVQTDINGNLKIAGTVTTSIAVGITPTDRTITSASGASQQLAAANASRHSLTIENTGNANCGVNPTGGTAAIGGAGTLTLAPLGSYTPAIPTLSAVTIICTAGQPIYGNEN